MEGKSFLGHDRLNLNQKVYRALAALAPPTNDPASKHYLERTGPGF